MDNVANGLPCFNNAGDNQHRNREMHHD